MGSPNLRIEIPNNGDVIKLLVLILSKFLLKAVKTNETISLIFIGAMNKLVKVSAPNFL